VVEWVLVKALGFCEQHAGAREGEAAILATELHTALLAGSERALIIATRLRLFLCSLLSVVELEIHRCPLLLQSAMHNFYR